MNRRLGFTQRLDNPPHQGGFLRRGDQMDDDFRVRRRLENRTRLFELFAQQGSIDEIAVVRDRYRALRVFDDEWLGIFQMTLALSRIPVMADGAWRLRAA